MSRLATPARGDHPAPPRLPMAERLRRFLSCYWLRPENALWMTLRSQVLDAYRFELPSLDLSCGDGVFSFLHAGGALDEDFDVFRTVGQLDNVRTQHADMFDHVDPSYAPRIVEPPRWRMTTGTDHKPALLAKAATLGFYDELVEADHNRPLPLPTGRYRTVFSNSIYWVSRIELHLSEIRRLAAPQAVVLLQVKLDSIRDYTLARHEPALGRNWLDLIGRGRFETWPTMGSLADWQRRFEGAGFAIRDVLPFVTRTHAHIWDIGLRPLAPLLVRMANSLEPATRRSVKRDWVELLTELLLPFARPDCDLFAERGEPAEVLFVLTRR